MTAQLARGEVTALVARLMAGAYTDSGELDRVSERLRNGARHPEDLGPAMTQVDFDDGAFKTEAAGIFAAVLGGQGLRRRRTSWSLVGNDLRWVLTIDRVPHLAQVHVIVGLDFDPAATTSANYCSVVTSAGAVAASRGRDRSLLDWAIRGATPIRWPERREEVRYYGTRRGFAP